MSGKEVAAQAADYLFTINHGQLADYGGDCILEVAVVCRRCKEDTLGSGIVMTLPSVFETPMHVVVRATAKHEEEKHGG